MADSARKIVLGLVPPPAHAALLEMAADSGIREDDATWLLLATQLRTQQYAAAAEAAVAEVAAALDAARATLPAALAAGARAALVEAAATGAAELSEKLGGATLAAIGRVGRHDTRAASALAVVAFTAAICAASGLGLVGGAPGARAAW